MTVVDGPDAAPGGAPSGDIVPGDLVRDLVARHEAEIADLEARLAVADAAAGVAERAVRRHPALVLLHPDEVRRLVPDPVDPAASVGRRPATTVVRRAPPAGGSAGKVTDDASPAGPRGVAGTGGTANSARPPDAGLGSRIIRSHWWWRAGIALVVVALLLLKFG